MVTWDYFRKVRRLQVHAWLRNRGISTYLQFVDRLQELGVIPPSESDFLEIAPTQQVPEESRPAANPLLPMCLPEMAKLDSTPAEGKKKRRRATEE